MNPSSQTIHHQDNLSTNESNCLPQNHLEFRDLKLEGFVNTFNKQLFNEKSLHDYYYYPTRTIILMEMMSSDNSFLQTLKQQDTYIERIVVGRIGHSKLDRQQNFHVFFDDQDGGYHESHFQDLEKKQIQRVRSASQTSSSQRLQDLQFAAEHLNSKKKGSAVIFKVASIQGREHLESMHHSNSFMSMLKIDPELFQIDFHTRQLNDLVHYQLIAQFLKSCKSSKEKKSFVCSVTHSLGRDIVVKGQCYKLSSTVQNSDKMSLSDLDQSNTDQSFASFSNQSVFYLVEISAIDNQFLMNPNLSNRRKEQLTHKFRKITEQEKLFLNTIKQFQSTLDKNLEKQLSREYKTCSYRLIKYKDLKN